MVNNKQNQSSGRFQVPTKTCPPAPVWALSGCTLGVNLSVYGCLSWQCVQVAPPPPQFFWRQLGWPYEPPMTPSMEKWWMDGKQNSKRYFKVCYIHLKVPKSLMWQKSKIPSSKKDNKMMIKHVYSNISKHGNKEFSSILSGKILIWHDQGTEKLSGIRIYQQSCGK